jgi:AraC-like DNA-binding protein
MTASANSLTERAMPTGRAKALLDALQGLGHDVPALAAAAAGLRPEDLEDPEATIVCSAVPAILELAFRTRPIANPGARLAAATPVGAYPLIDYLIVTSETVGTGLRHLARYLRAVPSPIQLAFHDQDEPIRVEFVAHGPSGSFETEYQATLIVLHLRQETANRLGGIAISLRHQPDDAAEFARLAGCPVLAGAGWDGLVMTRESWALPFLRRDPILHGLLARQAADLDRLDEDFPLAVRRAIAAQFAQGEPSVDNVARSLATSRRTLQRRLRDRGRTFQELLDLTRREAAERYLTSSRFSSAEVAYLLGYSEPAAFHRAFKRWHGATPQEYRKRLR